MEDGEFWYDHHRFPPWLHSFPMLLFQVCQLIASNFHNPGCPSMSSWGSFPAWRSVIWRQTPWAMTASATGTQSSSTARGEEEALLEAAGTTPVSHMHTCSLTKLGLCNEPLDFWLAYLWLYSHSHFIETVSHNATLKDDTWPNGDITVTLHTHKPFYESTGENICRSNSDYATKFPQIHFGSTPSTRSLCWRRMMIQRTMRWPAVSWWLLCRRTGGDIAARVRTCTLLASPFTRWVENTLCPIVAYFNGMLLRYVKFPFVSTFFVFHRYQRRYHPVQKSTTILEPKSAFKI